VGRSGRGRGLAGVIGSAGRTDRLQPTERATVGDLYEHGQEGWANGAELVYAPLAEALVASSPVDLEGRLVLDAGAGTGAGSRALIAVGARPVAVDLAWTMLAHRRRHRPPAAVADLLHLPLAPRSLDAVLAPFVLNHLDRPTAALAGLAAGVRRGGVVLASTFAEADRPAVKDLVDDVATRHGFRPPPAYEWLRCAALPLLGSADAMAAAARAGGLTEVRTSESAVDTGVRGPADQVAYRLGMPHLSHFLSSLPPDRRDHLVAEAVAAVADVDDGRPLAPTVVFLSARVG